MDRFLFYCKGDKEKLKHAVELQFQQDQPAIIYYGSEVGMSQDKSLWEITKNGDIQARRPMDWLSQDNELIDFYKKIIAL